MFDIDTGNSIEYIMATAIPEIKATNIAQQLGGCVTYTERYLKMSAFGIVDNNLDPDTTNNTKKTEEQKITEQVRITPQGLTKVAKLFRPVVTTAA